MPRKDFPIATKRRILAEFLDPQYHSKNKSVYNISNHYVEQAFIVTVMTRTEEMIEFYDEKLCEVADKYPYYEKNMGRNPVNGDAEKIRIFYHIEFIKDFKSQIIDHGHQKSIESKLAC